MSFHHENSENQVTINSASINQSVGLMIDSTNNMQAISNAGGVQLGVANFGGLQFNHPVDIEHAFFF